jgi:hypothetical protein
MNRYVEHVYVVPEDDANRQIAVGFVGYPGVKDVRLQVMPVAGGWQNVLTTFKDEYIRRLRSYPLAHIVMLVDFDGHVDERRALFENEIPDDIRERVFLIGSKYNPETLKRNLNRRWEDIGESLASDCDVGTVEYWGHDQLQHNDAERQRLTRIVRPFLF